MPRRPNAPPDARLEFLQSLIEHYGYFAIFVGCFLEGETVLVLGGFAAHMGYLSLPAVIATAAVAGFIGDQVLFWIGRRWGEKLFASHPALAALRPRATQLLDKYGGWAAFGLRFMVGMRLAGAIAIGAAGFPERRFLPANAAGASVWAVVIGGAGYAFGQAFTLFLERARHLELAAFAGLAVIGVVAVFLMRRRQTRIVRLKPDPQT
jgi:membrane protein DedA with SNARE-associated domain